MLVDSLYEHGTFGEEPSSFVNRFALWWGAPYPLLLIALFAAPLGAALTLVRRAIK